MNKIEHTDRIPVTVYMDREVNGNGYRGVFFPDGSVIGFLHPKKMHGVEMIDDPVVVPLDDLCEVLSHSRTLRANEGGWYPNSRGARSYEAVASVTEKDFWNMKVKSPTWDERNSK